MISNSGHDERWKASGGAAGDQDGSEWQVRTWYNRPWDMILRYPDRKVGDTLADLSRQAANNNKIGYDQGQRTTYWNALKKAGYHPKDIKTACEADCSAGVLANVKATGYLLNIQKLKDVYPDGWTGSMRSQLTAAGFNALTDAKYLVSDDYLLPGDILLNEAHHTAVNLDKGRYAGGAERTTEENVRHGQQWLNDYYGAFQVRTWGEILEVDGLYGKKTRRAALSIWKDVCNRLYGTDLPVKNEKFGSGAKAAADKYAVVEFGSSGTHTLILQLLLSAYGYYYGRMDADCMMELCVSIQACERDRHLTVDSEYPERCSAGKQVWSSLFEEV